jgi:hypothetical protein
MEDDRPSRIRYGLLGSWTRRKRALLYRAWRVLCSGNAENSQVALAIAVIATIGTFGCIAVFLYGFVARECQAGCPGGLSSQVAGGFVAVFAAAGAFSIGGVLGLLFGSPRWGDVSVVPVGPAASTGSMSASSNGSTTSAPPPAQNTTASPGSGVRPNTSLERIADWLTTVIVGLSLVHVKELLAAAQHYGSWVTGAITLESSAASPVPGGVISASFGFAGFVLVYLWSLRFLPSELERAYERELAKRVAQKTEELTGDILKTIDEFKARPIFRVQNSVLDAMKADLKEAGVDDGTIEEIHRRYSEATRWTDEPMQGFGPCSQQGNVLSASVTGRGNGDYVIRVSVKVADEAVVDCVRLLHNTFPSFYEVDPVPESRTVAFDILARGSFWIGIVLARPGRDALRLGMDLASAEGATPEFRDS